MLLLCIFWHLISVLTASMNFIIHLVGHLAVHFGHEFLESATHSYHNSELLRIRNQAGPYRDQDIITIGKGFILINNLELYKCKMRYDPQSLYSLFIKALCITN